MWPHNSTRTVRTPSIGSRSASPYDEVHRSIRTSADPPRVAVSRIMTVQPESALRVLIVDDEELARLRLRGLVNDNPQPRAEVVGEAGNAAQALVCLAAERGCDVVLLDIQMPGRDGMQLAAELRAMAQPPAVVFVTAHAEHALRAFELDAIDYLTKPVKRDRLQAALQRAVQRLNRPAAQPP